MMEANHGNPPDIEPKQKIIKNQTPAIFFEVVNNVVLVLEKYGWFILLGVIIAAFLWSKLEPYWTKWNKKREEEIREQCFDPATLAKTQEAIELSRKKMQEKTDAKAAEFADKLKEIEEVKRREKIDEWERHQQGRGYRSKHPKPDAGPKKKDNNLKPKKSSRLRNSDYNPLTGSSSGTSYRPSRRSTGGGGG